MYIVIVVHTQKIKLIWEKVSSAKYSTPLTKLTVPKIEGGLIDGLLTIDFFGNKASSKFNPVFLSSHELTAFHPNRGPNRSERLP